MFEAFLKSLPDSIYRIKGYIKFNQSQLPTLFQFSYGVPLYMKESMDMPLNLVFIGEGIDWKSIENKLNALEKE
jgi:G3E family GTPase